MKYKTLFFDLDDTIYDFGAASREAFAESYELLEYGRFFASFDEYMALYAPRNLQLWELYGRGEITKDELNRMRFSYPLECVGVHDEALVARFCKEALGRIPTKGILIPGAKELLEYLSPKYDMHIISNGFQELQERKMQSAGVRHYFGELVLSDHIGVNKPRRELFDYALERCGADVEHSIMIGDMFETDIVGAANIGMNQIFFNRKGIRNLPFKPTFEVATLGEIKSIL